MNILLFVLGWGGVPPAAVEVHHLPWQTEHDKEDAPWLGKLTGIAYLCRGILGVIHYSSFSLRLALIGLTAFRFLSGLNVASLPPFVPKLPKLYPSCPQIMLCVLFHTFISI